MGSVRDKARKTFKKAWAEYQRLLRATEVARKKAYLARDVLDDACFVDE